MAHTSQKGTKMLVWEVSDGAETAPVRVTFLGAEHVRAANAVARDACVQIQARCSDWQDKLGLIVGEKNLLSPHLLDTNGFACRAQGT
eukprot:2065923-Amphidinium_carterae.1